MSDSTRRGFLKFTGAGVAAVGAAAVIPAAVTRSEGQAADVALPKDAQGSLMAHVHDVRKGEVTLMVEGREVVVTDHQLVARLTHALHHAEASTSDAAARV